MVCEMPSDTERDSATKAKTFGWFGFVDSYEGILSVAREFANMKIIPDPAQIQTTR